MYGSEEYTVTLLQIFFLVIYDTEKGIRNPGCQQNILPRALTNFLQATDSGTRTRCKLCVYEETAIRYCRDCDHFIDDKCTRRHSEIRLWLHHTLIKLILDPRRADFFDYAPKSFCKNPNHLLSELNRCETKYELNHFCIKCQKLFCAVCRMEHNACETIISLGDRSGVELCFNSMLQQCEDSDLLRRFKKCAEMLFDKYFRGKQGVDALEILKKLVALIDEAKQSADQTQVTVLYQRETQYNSNNIAQPCDEAGPYEKNTEQDLQAFQYDKQNHLDSFHDIHPEATNQPVHLTNPN